MFSLYGILCGREVRLCKGGNGVRNEKRKYAEAIRQTGQRKT